MRGLARDTCVLLAERGLRLVVGILTTVYCARALGPEHYGLYSYALSLVMLFSFLGQAGLEPILVRELIRQERASSTATLSSAFALRLLGALVAGVFAISTAQATSSPELPATQLVALLAVPGLLQTLYVADAWLQARLSFRRSSSAKTVALLIAGVLRVIAVSSERPLLMLALVMIVESGLTGLLLMSAAKREGLGPRALLGPLDRGEWRRLAALARPMLLSSAAVALYARADMFLLGQLSTRRELGLYSAATSLSEAFYLLPVALMTAATPRLATLHQVDEAGFRRACTALVCVASAAGLAIALSISLLASPLLALVYGPSFDGAAGMLAIHVWSTWMVFISVASEPWYINRGLHHLYVRKTLVAAASNLILNVLLIPTYGGVGAAIATAISYGLSSVACNVLWGETRELFFMQLRAISSLPKPSLLAGHA